MEMHETLQRRRGVRVELRPQVGGTESLPGQPEQALVPLDLALEDRMEQWFSGHGPALPPPEAPMHDPSGAGQPPTPCGTAGDPDLPHPGDATAADVLSRPPDVPRE